MTSRSSTKKRSTCVLYLRLSDARDDASTSIDRQRADLTAEAERRGLTVVGEHVDDGVSGRKARAKADAAVAQLRDGSADALLVWKFDRYSRQGLGAVATLIETLDAVPSALFVALQDGLNSDQPAWRIIASVLAEVARMEADNTALRVSSAIRHLKNIGRWHGGRLPVGYMSIPHPTIKDARALTPAPGAVELFTKIARDIVNGGTVYAATVTLNASDLRPPAASAWTIQTVRRALTGHGIVGRVSVRMPGTSREERKFDVIRNEDGTPREVWPPILPIDLWRACRDELLARSDAAPMASRQRLPSAHARVLSGLLVCSGCGGPMYVGTANGKPRYACAKRPRGQQCTPERPNGSSVTAEALEAWIAEQFLAAVGASAVMRVEQHEVPAVELAEAKEALRTLTERLGDPDTTDDEADRLTEQLRSLRRRVRDLAEAGPPPSEVRYVETGDTFASIWAAADTEGRRALLAQAIDHVTVGPGLPGSKRFDPSRFTIRWIPSPDERGATADADLADAAPEPLVSRGDDDILTFSARATWIIARATEALELEDADSTDADVVMLRDLLAAFRSGDATAARPLADLLRLDIVLPGDEATS